MGHQVNTCGVRRLSLKTLGYICLLSSYTMYIGVLVCDLGRVEVRSGACFSAISGVLRCDLGRAVVGCFCLIFKSDFNELVSKEAALFFFVIYVSLFLTIKT